MSPRVATASLTALLAVLTLSPLSPAVGAEAAEVTPISYSALVDTDVPGSDDPCFHQPGHLSGTFTTEGHAIEGDIFHQLVHTTFDYSIRFADPAIPLYSGRQVTNETILANPNPDVFIYNFVQVDNATASDKSRYTVRETIHFTVVQGVIKAEVNRFTFSCPS